MKIAVVNCGSSSLKFKLFEMPCGAVLREELVEHIGEKDSLVQDHEDAINSLHLDLSDVDLVGHRVVHGGEKFHDAVIINDAVMQTISELSTLAPLHNPANLQGIQIFKKFAPDIPHIAVFDTSFHNTLQKSAYLYALPYEMYEKHHIRRYGFHGTSHKFLLDQASKLIQKNKEDTNLITLHLGNGESICAIKNGKSVDTSMGFTPLEGLIMGSRSGDLDPEIVVYMQKVLGLGIEEVDEILNKRSGLIGICGENDVRKILSRKDQFADLAIEMMVRRIQKYIGSYLVLLEGKVDALVFSGGIGEHSELIRQKICDNELIKSMKSLVIETDEELEIVNECLQFL